MKVEQLEFADLPYMGEKIRMSGYRIDEREEDGSIKLETRPTITGWQLVKKLWRGKGLIVWTSEDRIRALAEIRCLVRSDSSRARYTSSFRFATTDRLL